jgi:hypothetical protein
MFARIRRRRVPGPPLRRIHLNRDPLCVVPEEGDHHWRTRVKTQVREEHGLPVLARYGVRISQLAPPHLANPADAGHNGTRKIDVPPE